MQSRLLVRRSRSKRRRRRRALSGLAVGVDKGLDALTHGPHGRNKLSLHHCVHCHACLGFFLDKLFAQPNDASHIVVQHITYVDQSSLLRHFHQQMNALCRVLGHPHKGSPVNCIIATDGLEQFQILYSCLGGRAHFVLAPSSVGRHAGCQTQLQHLARFVGPLHRRPAHQGPRLGAQLFATAQDGKLGPTHAKERRGLRTQLPLKLLHRMLQDEWSAQNRSLKERSGRETKTKQNKRGNAPGGLHQSFQSAGPADAL